MANVPQSGDLVEPPRPLAPQRGESLHPGQHPDITNVPVTPGIDVGEYGSGDKHSGSSYFGSDMARLRGQMSQAETGKDLLKKMTLSSKDQTPEVEPDPKTANPSLSLSGSVISATFCIPHSLEYRKGADWVSLMNNSCGSSD